MAASIHLTVFIFYELNPTFDLLLKLLCIFYNEWHRYTVRLIGVAADFMLHVRRDLRRCSLLKMRVGDLT